MKPAKKFALGQQVIYSDVVYIIAKIRWHTNRQSGAQYWQHAVWDDVVGSLEWYCGDQLVEAA